MTAAVDLVVFDKDGTLFEFEATWGAWVVAVVRELAMPTCSAEALAQAVGYDLAAGQFDADALVIAGSGEEVIAVWLSLLGAEHEAHVRDVCRRHEQALPLVPCADIASALAPLRDAGAVLAVATNDYVRVAEEHLDTAGVRSLFDHVMGCDSGFDAKPAAGMLAALCERTGVPPHRAAMVGDSTRDLQAARNAGYGLAIGVLTGPARRDELTPLADGVLDSVAALAGWLQVRTTRSR
ncbi:MAG: HAD family hydrolase [Pseudomonadota bacterium]